MKMQLEQIVHNLFHTSSLEHVPSERLQEMAKRYPYFSIAHLLLARKLQLENEELFEPQVQKTALYFHDPLWLHWQLDHENKENGFAGETFVVNNVEVAETEIRPTEISAAETTEVETYESEISGNETYQAETTGTEAPEVESSGAETYQTETSEAETYTEDEAYTKTEVDIREQEELSVTHQPLTDNNEEEEFPAEAVVEESSFHTEKDFDDETTRVESQVEEPSFHANGDIKEKQSFNETRDPESVSIQQVTDQAETFAVNEERPQIFAETEKEQEQFAEQGQDPDDTDEVHTGTSAASTSGLSEQTAEKLNPLAGKLVQTPLHDNAPLAFDAYYTIDYFASQGIKAPAEVQPGDKLGKQLKSFTEWLKTMKRLPQAQTESQTDEREQQTIRQFADGSLVQKEVVTETMAEVLVKQDKKEEAIAIYEKLSLLDPSKSGYFAAKIENLKVN
ncbi:MAG TPA: hypothetical protein VGD17_20395 [Chitinophagaceae bacterium]